MWCVRETRRQSCVRPVGRRGRRGGSPGPAARGCSLQWARRERFSSGLVRLRFGGLWSTLRSVSHLTAWNAKEVLHAELDEAAAKVRADVRWEPTVTHLLSLSLSLFLRDPRKPWSAARYFARFPHFHICRPGKTIFLVFRGGDFSDSMGGGGGGGPEGNE